MRNRNIAEYQEPWQLDVQQNETVTDFITKAIHSSHFFPIPVLACQLVTSESANKHWQKALLY